MKTGDAPFKPAFDRAGIEPGPKSSRAKGRVLAWLPGFNSLALVLAAVLFLLPLVWLVLSSLKPGEQLIANPHTLLPEQVRWQNYQEVFASVPFLRYLQNSLWLCLGSVVGTIISCSLAGYGFGRLQWKGRELVFGLVILTLMLPWFVTLVPRFLLIRELGLYNSLWALVGPRFLGDAYYIFLLRQYFRAIPEELLEAGRLDGCGEWGLYRFVVLPLSKPALATVALFQFVASWNDFQGPLFFLRDPERFPLAYGLERLVSSYSSQTHLLLAGSVLYALPAVLVFWFAQRYFVGHDLASSVKG